MQSSRDISPAIYQSGFFTPETARKNQNQAKELLEYVLYPTDANIQKLRDLAKTKPQCFFIKATAQDHAKDLKGNRRTLEDWSPYQAMFGTSDTNLIAEINPLLEDYLKTNNDNDFAENHVKEKFPNGFDFSPSTFDFDPLVAAISADPFTDGVPSANTLALLEQFQEAFKPGVVTSGHHFNMNDVMKADDLLVQHWNSWSDAKRNCFDINVRGFLQRLKTGVYLQADISGLGFLRGYELTLMSEYPETQTLAFNCDERGFNYRVIRGGTLHNSTIPWTELPNNFPRNDADILANQDELLPMIFKFTSKAGHTKSLKRDFVLYNHASGVLEKPINLLPLDTDPDCVLGKHVVALNYFNSYATASSSVVSMWAAKVQRNWCREITADLLDLLGCDNHMNMQLRRQS